MLLLAAACALSACASTQSRFAPLDGKHFPPRDPAYEITVFETGLPSRDFERIARLDVHLEKTVFIQSSLQDALSELKRQARQAGANAVIELREQRSSVGETRIYHLTATAIRYTEAQTP